MRVIVDTELCEGNGVCETIAPEIFEVDEETYQARLLMPAPGPEWREEVEEAVRRCPKAALSIEE